MGGQLWWYTLVGFAEGGRSRNITSSRSAWETHFKKRSRGIAGEMTQWLRALSLLRGCPGSIPSTHVAVDGHL